MTDAVQVIVDPDDDVANTRTIHRLAANQPTVLAVSITPDLRSSPAVIWAILRALGKRTENLAGCALHWHDAQTWLAAHHITELVVLRAQHLSATSIDDLERHAKLAGATLTLVYSGPTRARLAATATLTDLINRTRNPRQISQRQPPWPTIPRSHPLRLRYECSQRLQAENFLRVDELLAAAFGALRSWLIANPHPTCKQLCFAISLMSAGHDPEQSYIRRSAVAIALACGGVTSPPGQRQMPLTPRRLTENQVSSVLAYTDPAAAGYELAELLTGLTPDLLERVGGDQITDDSILGHTVPASARPVLRALSHDCRPVLTKPASRQGRSARPAQPRDISPDLARLDDDVVTAVALLLRGRRQCIPAADLTPTVRAELDTLQSDQILELERGAYGASHIALYSTYLITGPPHAPATAKQAGQTTAIEPDTH